MTQIVRSDIDGAWLINPIRHSDDRGWFQELFKHSAMRNLTGVDFKPLQINVSHSNQGVIRGIHYSVAPEGQAKYVSVMDGQIDDYIIDVRQGSPTFGKWQRVRLTAAKGEAVFLGMNLAHAFQVISNSATVCYAVSAEFNPDAEKAINPLCPSLDIQWDKAHPIVMSPKDQVAPTLEEQIAAGLIPEF